MLNKTSLFSLFILILLVNVNVAYGHEMRPGALNIVETTQGHFNVSWKVPAKSNRRMALSVLLDGEPAFTVTDSSFIGGAHIQTGEFERAQGIVGATIHIKGLDTTFTDVMLRVERLNGEVIAQRLNPEHPSYQLTAQPKGLSLIKTYIQYGFEHILLGIDHLLFVACIVLIAGFSRRLLWAISGFTLAHSLTLGLAALDIIRLPIAAVEAVIALSIVFLALEIAKQRRDSLSYRYPVIVSSGFGLLHGFGFAAVLAEIGLPSNEALTALLCFNLGVELGQLLFIGLLLVGIKLAGQWAKSTQLTAPSAQKWQWLSSYAIGSVAFMWMIERTMAF